MRRFFMILGIALTATLLFFFTSHQEQTVRADGKINTEIAVSVIPTPSVYGQPITYTAYVTASSSSSYTPTGDVVFNVVGYGQIIGQLDDTGEATATLNTLLSGSYVVFATYNGDANFNASISPVIIQIVTNASTTTELSGSTDTSIYGQPVTFTATVTAVAPSESVPKGDVVFSISGYGSILGSLDGSRKATATINTLDVGSYTVTSTYIGNSEFYPSISPNINLTVNQATTTTTLTSSPNPSDLDQAVTFTASVTPVSPGAGTPAGTITFTVDGTPSAPFTLVNGEAIYSVSFPTSGEHTVSAQYSGDSNFIASSSQLLIQNVRTETAFSLLSSKNPSNRNDPVTFTTLGLPDNVTGIVTFFDGGAEFGASQVINGKAEFTVPSFSPGDHTVTAQYSGDSTYAPSISPDFTQTVSTLYSYTIRYVDELSGASLAPDVQGSGQLGEEITINAPDIEGYLLQDSSSKTFTINAGSNIETFSYISVSSMVLLVIVANIITAAVAIIVLRVLP